MKTTEKITVEAEVIRAVGPDGKPAIVYLYGSNMKADIGGIVENVSYTEWDDIRNEDGAWTELFVSDTETTYVRVEYNEAKNTLMYGERPDPEADGIIIL